MTSPAADPPITFKTMGREKRREVLRLANMGERHPDPAIAAAAYQWAHADRWNTLANRLPGWLLPLLGVICSAVVILTGLPAVLAVGGVLVLILGLLGWLSTSMAHTVRDVYADQGTTKA